MVNVAIHHVSIIINTTPHRSPVIGHLSSRLLAKSPSFPTFTSLHLHTMNRRQFLMASAGTLTAMDLFSALDKNFAVQLEKRIGTVEGLSATAAAENEDFWGWVRESYSLSTNIINLNNGGVSP